MNRTVILFGLLLTIVSTIVLSPVLVYSEKEDLLIPEWIKGVALFWVEESIDDEEFIEALEFLLENEIIQVPGWGEIDIEDEPIDMILSVNTDKEEYIPRDVMQITGTLPDYNQHSIVIVFSDPDNMLAALLSFDSNGSGEYSTSINIGGPSMYIDGDYTLRVQYEGESVEKTVYLSAD